MLFGFVYSPISTHYFPTLYQHQYEMEDGRTVRGGPVRYGYDESIFPGYSWRGYCVLSRIQVCLQKSTVCTYRYMYVRYYILPLSPEQAPPVKASICALDILAFTGGAY